MHGFGRMLSYEQYLEEKSRLWLSSFTKKLIKPHGGLLDVTTNIYLKSCAYCPDSECYKKLFKIFLLLWVYPRLNELPTETKNMNSFHTFKRMLLVFYKGGGI